MDKTLYAHLSSFVTSERLLRFQEVIPNRTRHLTFVIEDVNQPHNASAVVRSCDCFGIQDIHVIEETNTYKTDKKIALGASKWVNVLKHRGVKNTSTNCLTHLKKKGYKIVATTPHKDDFTPDTIPIEEPLAVVFGKEVEGISEEVVQQADYFMKIPMYGFTESLNISVAAAITAQNLYQRLLTSNLNWRLSEAEKNDVLFNWLKKSIKDSDRIIDLYYRNNPKLLG